MQKYDKTKKVCNKCGQSAKIWYNNKWWCATTTLMGKYNIIGFCKEKK